MVFELLWNAAWAYRCCLEASTPALSGGNKSTAAVFRNGSILLLSLLRTVLAAFLIQNTWINSLISFLPDIETHPYFSIICILLMQKKQQLCNHWLFLVVALLFQTLFSTVDMRRVSFSQGNGALQEPNRTGGLVNLPVSSSFSEFPASLVLVSNDMIIFGLWNQRFNLL